MSQTLLIRAQDLHFYDIGLAKDDRLLHEKRCELSPEHLLAGIAEAIKEWGVTQDQIRCVMIVNGPGSCTASRVSVTIANTFAYTGHLPLLVIAADPQESFVSVWKRAQGQNVEKMAFPTYTSQPHLTSPHS